MNTQLDHEIIAALERIVARTPKAGPSPCDIVVRCDEPPRRRPMLVAAGALAVAGVVATGIVVSQRSDNGTAAPPASQPWTTTPPANTEVATPNTGPTPVAAPTPAESELTLFPVIGTAAQPGDFGSYSQIGGDNPQRVTAVVARRDGTALADGIQIDVVSQLPELPGTPEAITIHDVAADMYTEPGTPALRTVVLPETSPTVLQGAALPGRPAILVQGLDPVGFLQSAGVDVISVVAVTSPAAGQPPFTLSFGSLPAGYELIVPPFESPRGTTNASTGVGTADASDGDGALIEVSLLNPLPGYATVGTLTPVDINGVSGWLSSTAGNAVIWSPEPGTFATVAGVPSADESLAIARSVRFVDEATWQQFYAVAPPNFGSS